MRKKNKKGEKKYQLAKIILVASNSIIRHPRIWKTVSSLKKKYEISVLGWNREGILSEDFDKYIVPISLFGMRAPFGRPTVILYYPLFWTWILFRLLVNRPSVVHSIDLDTLLPCALYKLIARKRLVYDVHDRFGGYVPQKYKTLYNFINWVEEVLSKQANVLITVSERVQRTFRLHPKNCEVIMNFSEDCNINKTKSKDNVLTLVYTGLIIKDQGLEIVTSALQGLKDVRLVLAGRVGDKELLDKMLELPNVNYLGLLERAKSLELEASSDAMVVLYDLNYRKNQLSSPNKIFEAMMCGIPLITNMEVNLIREIDCGLIVDYDTSQVRNAIINLRNDSGLRTRLGNNGRKAYVEKYNWDSMEKELYRIYSDLTTK
jgi:glycosyltransferase involved in cell wall biosynthesis